MKCKLCKNNVIYKDLCREHFIEYFEDKVKLAIKRFKLLKKTDKVAVAVSGGKDSMSVLTILTNLGYDVTVITIDEGIHGYREKTLDNVRQFCKTNNIKLNVYSFKEEYGKPLDTMSFKGSPCSICGVLRRDILNNYSKGFDVLATGHNMDDEAQAVIMNLLKNNLDILPRLGPISGVKISKKFTKRVKPLYLCSEKEVALYSKLKKVKPYSCCCPNKQFSFRLRILRLLDNLEVTNPNIKNNIINWFLKYKKSVKGNNNDINTCVYCGNPSSKDICKKCVIVQTI